MLESISIKYILKFSFPLEKSQKTFNIFSSPPSVTWKDIFLLLFFPSGVAYRNIWRNEKGEMERQEDDGEERRRRARWTID